MKTKRILATLIAVMMLAAMMVLPAGAAGETYDITINDAVEGNSYAAYRIFKGELKLDEATGGTVLSTIKWADEAEDGSSAKGAAILAALASFTDTKNATPFAGLTTAQGVADVLDTWTYNETDIKNFADVVAGVLLTTGTADGISAFEGGKHVITGLQAGYYLIVTSNAVETSGYTDYLLKVTNNVAVDPKVSLATLTKSVGNTLDGTYNNGADFQVGMSESTAGSNVVYFKLDGTLPSDYANYKQYYYRMEDTIDLNIYAVEEGAAHPVQEIYREHSNGGRTYVDDTVVDSYVDYNEVTGKLVIDFGNLKAHGHPLNTNDHVIVKIKLNLIGQPVVGKGAADGMGNVNTANLYFSNDPNQEDVADGVDYKGVIKMGTATDDAYVYTYGIKLTKVDAANQTLALPNAEFVLSRMITTSVDNGGTMQDVTTRYYAKVTSTGSGYKVTEWVAERDGLNLTDMTMVTDANGIITVSGLDGVEYFLTETKAPVGYNQLTEDVAVNIQANIDATTGELTALGGVADSKNGTGDVVTGILSFSIVNNGGATLPETGGMGTTIFYIAGVIMMAGAATVLLAKKRAAK